MATLAARAHPAAVASTAEPAPVPDGRLAGLYVLLRFGLAMAVLLAIASLPTASFFSVREVAVAGARVVPAAAITARSGIRVGDRLRDVEPVRAARRIAAIPRIASAEVTVGLGGRVTLTVRERHPYAAVPYRGRYLILDAAGVVMDVALGPGRLPVVTAEGLAPRWMRPGDRLPDPRITLALRALGELPPGLRVPGLRIRAASSGDLALVTPDGITVRLGPMRGLRGRAELLPELLAAVRARALAVEYLDLRFAGTVLMKPLAAPGAGERP
jgi:cell division protein FtsQ